MAAFKLYVRGAAADVLIDDLGFTVAQGPGWTQLNSDSPGAGLGDSGQFTARELRDSADLVALIGAGTLEWSKDGASAEASGDYVADFMLMQDFTDDHLDLTSGILTVPTGDEPPVAGQEGNIWWDAGDHGLYMHDGANWMLVATSSGVQNDHGALTGLGDDDHPQYHDGSLPYTGDLDMGGFSISGVNLVDGVDVSALYTFAHGITVITDHGGLSGLGDDDHPQYHDGSLPWTGDINVGGYSISGVNLVDGVDVSLLKSDFDSHSGDATIHFTVGSIDHTLLQNIGTNSHADIDNHIADTSIHFPMSGIDHGVLQGLGDDDHPQYPQWATAETISGVWTFDPADTSPNLILEPVAVAPVNDLADGAIAVIGGILCAYDATRSKWLSVDRKLLTGSKDGAAKDVYLRHDNIAMSQTGLRALRNGTITGIFLQTDVAATWTLEVRRNGTVTVLASLASGGAVGAQSATINADFSAGDELQLYANTSGGAILAPIAGIEIAWRF